MEILSAGSFINLENQKKIEQLKFTAVELANAAMETTGFVNTEESGKNLALEFWQGLEYMCRETEEATIKNIFLNHFLECLRQFRSTQSAAEIDLPQMTEQVISEQIHQAEKPEDEFLGVIELAGDEENPLEENQSMPTENVTQVEEILTSEKSSIEEVEVKTTENISPETIKETASPASEIEEKVEAAMEKPVETGATSNKLSLPEKEPYQFNKCTVTATIQMLPEGTDGTTVRKAVFSVRTHDFAPQISLVELAGNNLTAEIMPELEKVLAKYQADLPLKVMDKLKKEKTTAKRNAPKQAAEAKTVSQAAAKQGEVSSSQTAVSETAQMPSPVIPPPAQTGLQGSLFG